MTVDVATPDSELAAIEVFAVDLARQAGELLERLFTGPLDVRFKSKQGRDPVTEADEAAEALIRTAVTRRYPSHRFLGEEGGGATDATGYLWIVDPLDGTANFANGLPFFAASIGVLHHGMPVAAALYTSFGPDRKPCVLHARRGGGLKLDGEPFVRQARELSGRSRLSGVPAGFLRGFRYRRWFMLPPGETRSLGSIAVELGLVAAGTLQYALFHGPKIWDVAGGVLLVQEAGGAVWADNRGRWCRLECFAAPAGRALGEWKQAVVAGDRAILRKEMRRLHVRHTPAEVAVRVLGPRRSASLARSIKRFAPAGRVIAASAKAAARLVRRTCAKSGKSSSPSSR